MSRKLRWGVLSTAKIAVEKVIPAMRSARWAEVTAIASREEARAQEAADLLQVPRAHDSYEALLDDPDVDVIYNPLPNHLHAEWTVRAAEAGKHVLCEKPLAMSPDEAEEMIAACQRAGVTFMEAFMYRLHPQWIRTREIVRSGALGELVAVETHFSYFNDDPTNIRNIAAYGGGAMMDIGCYCLDLSRLLFDAEPRRVEGLVRRDPDLEVDILVSGLLGFPGGGQATFTCGTRCAPDQRVHVIGTDGRLVVEIPFNAPPDRPTRLLVTSHGGDSTRPEAITLPVCDQYALQADAFSRAVIEGREPPVPPDNGVANLRLIETLLA